ncbi:TerD family protein [Calidifontibacter sp. DB0510]|uniref:TerD family protein n=1 Tax=Metallococcus carri TaxID=1656884 RepID=A0A967B002_9MICO|nr:TerD family protein [Metallococcus carri]NHN56249.1 TerD family protein [Metallococcus carri]NOP38699.1 TerD family protein [Calidifontibacter sp. DB2511S]
MSVNLSKGQSVNLAKADGGALTRVRMGLGWDVKVVTKKGMFGGTKQVQRDIDLDASALVIGGGQVLDTIYYGNLRSRDGAINHTGDNLTGAGEGDDESIIVDLPVVAPSVEHIVFVVNSYSGDNFSEIENAFVRVVDSANRDQELARFQLTGSGTHTALVMAKVSRSGNGWTFTAIGQPGNGRTAHDLAPLALQAV